MQNKVEHIFVGAGIVTLAYCWIAHVKEMEGLNPRKAPNRKDPDIRKVPCPENKVESIRDALKHFGVI